MFAALNLCPFGKTISSLRIDPPAAKTHPHEQRILLSCAALLGFTQRDG
jgi:hypothetical protein